RTSAVGVSNLESKGANRRHTRGILRGIVSQSIARIGIHQSLFTATSAANKIEVGFRRHSVSDRVLIINHSAEDGTGSIELVGLYLSECIPHRQIEFLHG